VSRVRAEIATGGGGTPCPFCHVPRCKRSDYIRCARCGVNWMTGENLTRDPRQERSDKFLEQTRAMSKPKERSKEN
jgi:hypothetical protein